MSFWDAEDKIPVKQTKVAIQAEHGLDYVSGQKITIIVPPTVQYFQPKESYLKFEVELNQGGTNHPTRLQLDPHAGAQILYSNFKRRIWSTIVGGISRLQRFNGTQI